MSQTNSIGGGDGHLAALYAAGAAEATLAQASQSLEEQREQSRRTQREAEEAQRSAATERIDELRTAADFKLAAGVVGGAAQGAAAFMGDTASAVTEGAGKVGEATLGHFSTLADIRAQEHGIEASAHESRSTEERETQERAGRFADKAIAHAEQIAQARMDARLTASRG